MRAATTTRNGPAHRATRRPPGRLDSHKEWTDSGGPVLTNSSGSQTGTYTYSDYGTPSHTGSATTTLGYDGEYTDPTTGYLYLQARYYDPTTAQFLTRDPLEDITRAPYSYANDDPLDNSDPSGLWPGEGLWHDTLDVVAVPVYATYYASYQAGRGINAVGCSLGTVGCVVSHGLVAGSPIPEFEAGGLAGDVGLDWLKNKTTGNGESIFDEDICGGLLPRFIDNGGPKVWLPGLSKNPDGSIHVDFEW